VDEETLPIACNADKQFEPSIVGIADAAVDRASVKETRISALARRRSHLDRYTSWVAEAAE